ncbi:signal recognition particle protein [Acidobacteriota bacterium]
MMFEKLTDKLQGVFKKLRGHGSLNEEHLKEALKEIRLALLEADVNYQVVKSFTRSVKEKAIGQDVMKSLTPAQQVIKIVRDELIEILGITAAKLESASEPPTVILLVGLQGSGKTTTAGKLALWLSKRNRTPYLVPADVYRPAAIKQLQVVGKAVNKPVFDSTGRTDPVGICREALDEARKTGYDTLIVDTAGRLHIDEKLMKELEEIKKVIQPKEILFIADAMTGQDAVNSAGEFNRRLEVSGIVLTKMDGDARGGAALSIMTVTGKPIKFVGISEKYDGLEEFHPDRMASRILGMGDVLSLIEKTEAVIDREEAIQLEKKLRKDAFTLEDFLQQLKRIKKMGPLDQLLKMIPGASAAMKGQDMAVDEKELKRVEAIINSMTRQERLDHSILNGSRKRRIAKGSGTTVQEVNQLVKQFVQTRKLIRGLKTGKSGKFRLPMPH